MVASVKNRFENHLISAIFIQGYTDQMASILGICKNRDQYVFFGCMNIIERLEISLTLENCIKLKVYDGALASPFVELQKSTPN